MLVDPPEVNETDPAGSTLCIASFQPITLLTDSMASPLGAALV
jgi:hypothetical protein